MAGEWLKLECSTPDKPEVFAITAAMGWDDPDKTVGKLFRVWRWFDQQTTDGNAKGVTSALLDRIAGATGFAQAMINASWLEENDNGLVLPNFEKHNGVTAKSRAQTAKRVANYRADAPCNVSTVTESVTPPLAREEKRRIKTNEAFASFWAVYPKKKNKGHAEKAFAKLKPDNDLLQTILNAVEGAARGTDWLKSDGQFIPYPSTWLTARGWEDGESGGGAKPWEI